MAKQEKVEKKKAGNKPEKAEEDEDWSDEDEIDKDELYKELDQKGPFLRNDSGTLEPESLLKLRRIIIKHAALAFMDRKDELFDERIEFLKRKKYNQYKETLETTTEEFSKLMFDVTKTAAEFLDLDESTYEASVRELM